MEGDLLVGRDQEVAVLTSLLSAAREGHPRLVLCGGEPGIGKTRLAAELAAQAKLQGTPTAWGRAPEGTAPPPFWLWRQVLRSLGGLGGWPDAAGEMGDSGEARFLLFEAVTAQLRAAAADSGLLVVLDDVQWADRSSLLLLRHVLQELRDERLLIVATYRTVGAEGSDRWQSLLPDLVREPVTERIELRGLSPEDTLRCAAGVSDRPIPADLAARLHRLTGGNPFLARELGRSHTSADRIHPGVPTSVLGAVRKRVGRLSAPTGELLAAAAILGEQFPLAVAASLVGRPAVTCLDNLEEAADAGIIEAADVPGDWRFTHALVRDAVEASIRVSDAVRLHRRAAEAIERTYVKHLEPRLAQLARHWAVVATTGERANAVHWARRAATEATRALAYEEAARLYRLALDAGGPDLDVESRCLLLLDLARAHWHSADFDPCGKACRAAVTLARGAGRPDLVGEAALAVEPIGTLAWDLDIRNWCTEALRGLEDAGAAARAPLLARLAEASVYVGDDASAEEPSRRALELAAETGDPNVVVTALRARQIALTGPEHGNERAVLAARMIDAGLQLHRPAVEMWGRLWNVDIAWERGDLAAIADALARLDWCAERVGGPIAHWHARATRAALAQARGEFDRALEIAGQAFASVQALRHPTAFGAFAALACAVGHHTGHERTGLLPPPGAVLDQPDDAGEVRAAIFNHLAPAFMLAESGRLDEAADAYRGAGPVEGWRPPPYFRVLSWCVGALVAALLGERQDAEFFSDRLEGERGRQGVVGGGNTSYYGPVELYLGKTAVFLGRLDDAVADLTAATATCRAIGAVPFTVEAECELAAVLARRNTPGDAARARELAAAARAGAVRLGMTPWERRAAAITPKEGSGGPLSPREMEIAELVAQGLTNREIATAAFVSERTAQTHVQHILTKLGFSNRSQIVSWVAQMRNAGT